jgi:hypothetical protein
VLIFSEESEKEHEKRRTVSRVRPWPVFETVPSGCESEALLLSHCRSNVTVLPQLQMTPSTIWKHPEVAMSDRHDGLAPVSEVHVKHSTCLCI